MSGFSKREDGHCNHGNGNREPQGSRWNRQEQQCTESRTNNRQKNGHWQVKASDRAIPNERQRTAHAHESQRQHVSRNRNMRFPAQTYHRWNRDERCTACYNTENASKEENGNQENQLWC
jgi:hypothetical protein